jgi:alkylhydroperoxidase/carboxymuconolactone decarboxylase family protein YurZ
VTTWTEALQKNDPDFLRMVQPIISTATGDGELPLKVKTLMILFLDATRGEKEACKAVAARARTQGATEGEIRETIRLAFLTSGYSALVAGAAGLKE